MIFLISSVYTEIIVTKTFSRNENIVPRKKLSKNGYFHQRYEIPNNDFLTIVDWLKIDYSINTSCLKEIVKFSK